MRHTPYSSLDSHARDDYIATSNEYEYGYASDSPLHFLHHQPLPRRLPNHHHHHHSNDTLATTTMTIGSTIKRKPYKELLTEEEKRANHIASEQKRRNTIRNGFRDITELIPDLKDINSSKSTILFKAVDFIHSLEKRNRMLRRRAEHLESRLRMKQQQHVQYQHQQYQQHLSQQDLRPRSPTSPPIPALLSHGPLEPPLSLRATIKKNYAHLSVIKQESFNPYARPGSSQQQQLQQHTPPHQSPQRPLQPSYQSADRLQDIPHLYPVVVSLNQC
jgi:hypothetical protein